MVQLTTEVERSFLENGKEIVEFRVPAVSAGRAESNAILNARVKGMDEPQVTHIEEIGSSGIPSRSLFLVTVEAVR